MGSAAHVFQDTLELLAKQTLMNVQAALVKMMGPVPMGRIPTFVTVDLVTMEQDARSVSFC